MAERYSGSFGRAGRNVLDVSTGDQGYYAGIPGAFDERYYEPYQEWTENGPVTRYRLKPEIADRLGGRLQAGGAMLRDPSLIESDDEFGDLTPGSNIEWPQDDWLSAALPYIMPAALGGITAFHAGGFGGLGAAPEAGGVVSGTEGFTGLGGAGGSGLPGGAAGYGGAGLSSIADAGLLNAGDYTMAAANPALAGQGGSLLNWIAANPIQAARLGLGAASLFGGRGGAGGLGGGGNFIDERSPLRNTGAPDASAPSASKPNPNAPLNTAAGSVNAPIDTSGQMVMTTQGPMPASAVTGYVGQGQGGAKMAVSPAIQELLDIGNERIDRYRDRFIPLEDLIVDEATRAGSRAMQEERAADAAEDVSGQYRRARGITRRNLQRGGVNPFSAQGQALASGLDLEEAANRAAGMNLARRGERDSAFSKRLAAAGMGDKAISQGLSSLSGGVQALLDEDRTQASRDNTAAQVGATLAGIQSREREGAADRAAREREFTEGTRRWDLDFGEGTRRYDLGRGDRRYEYDTRLGFDRDRAVSDDEYRRANLNLTGGRYADEASRNRYRDIGSLLSGAGSFFDSGAGRSLRELLGFAHGGRAEYEEGGEVDGPGTETSDSIPAYLSDGEFVLPAEAVKVIDALDPGLLERLQKLGLKIRDMGEDFEAGETFEGDYRVEA